jgi:5-methyltetrahydrofolate--homocysteine methyltransferase
MENVKRGKISNTSELDNKKPEQKDDELLTGTEAKIALALKEESKTFKHSKISTDVKIPAPPFWGTRVVENLSLDEIFKYINETALIRGQWRVVRGKNSAEEYQKLLQEQIYPELEQLKEKVKRDHLLVPKAVYGYFPCQSDGNDLIVYHTENLALPKEWLRFSFPRQNDDRHLCISDYFAPKDSSKIDVVAFHMVTMGNTASEYSKQLFDSNRYKDYLYFHGLSVETTEALAELWHKHIREELSIAAKDSPDIKRLFSQGYQGSRFSFGYPACPNLEDHTKLFELLQPERIGVTLTDEWMMQPEQSTDAIIVHHPEARYFNIK